MNGIDLANWLNLRGTPFEALPLFITSLAIGLLMGVERERKHHTLAGIRTFPLTALFGTIAAMLGDSYASVLPLSVGLLATTAFGFLPLSSHEGDNVEPRTTTVVALLVVFGLGALVWHGHSGLAVACGIITTSLLSLKPELTGLSQKLDRRDLLSILQFAALSFIVLPLLPDRTFGPYQAINPHEVWLMVTLIVGVGLSGYLAVKILGERVGGPVLGILGGLVSSTATSLVYAREAHENPQSERLATSVILLANLVLFARLTLLCAALQPSALGSVAMATLPALVCGLIATLFPLRQGHNGQNQPELQLSNPSELKVAIGFGLMFAAVMFCAAWLNTVFGSKGVYVVALISGINDVDAISLTALNLFGQTKLTIHQTVTTMVLAITANTLFKYGLIASLGGKSLALRCLPTFVATLVGMLAGLSAVWLMN